MRTTSKRNWLRAAALSAATFVCVVPQASATTITFDDLPTPVAGGSLIPNGYDGLTWTNFSYIKGASISPSGLKNGVVSTPDVAFNKNGNVASFSSTTPFEVVDLELTSAWDNGLFVSIVGSLSGQAIKSFGGFFNTSGPILVTLDWPTVTEVSFSATCISGPCSSAGFRGGSGTVFAIDNLNIAPSPAPLPAALPLFAGGLGALGLLTRRRRKAAS